MFGQYYSEFYPGNFNQQEIVHNKLRFPERFVRLSDAVPLTTCLLIAKESLFSFQQEMEEYNKKLIEYQDEIHTAQRANNFQEFQAYSPERMILNTSGSATIMTIPCVEIIPYAGGAVSIPEYIASMKAYKGTTFRVEQTKIVPKKDEIDFRDIIGYLHLYGFLAMFGTILDRFSHEINDFYQLGIDDIDWRKLVNKIKPNQTNPRKTIEIGEKVLGFHESSAKNILRHRNRFVHDGYAEFSVDLIITKGWKVNLHINPDDNNSLFTFDVSEEFPKVLSNLLNFLDETYRILSLKIDSQGQPPW